MKKTALLLILIASAVAGKGQNLVPNGDFEQYIGCPMSLSQLDSCSIWMNPATNMLGMSGTPDYFNACSPGILVSVPTNFSTSYQPAHSGGAYTGIILFHPSVTEREYIEVPLTVPLISNTCYHFEMFINLLNHSASTSDVIGAYFSDTAITGISNYLPLPFIPQINHIGFITDTLNWTSISGNFMAAGGESYLIIGNFNDDANTGWYQIGTGTGPSYFYIDDVSLTPCTGIEEQNNSEAITIYPNPAKEYVIISSEFGVKEKAEITITDILGKQVYRNQLTSNCKLQTSNYLPGIYFIEINNGKTVYRKKFLKQ
jgi:hypothetical protein